MNNKMFCPKCLDDIIAYYNGEKYCDMCGSQLQKIKSINGIKMEGEKE